MSAAPDTLPLDPQLLHEAADWLLQMRFDEPDAATRAAFAAWLSKTPAHARVWAHAAASLDLFTPLAGGPARAAAHGLLNRPRRRLLGLAMAGGGLAGLAALTWQAAPGRRWTADARTGRAQRRMIALDDGSRLHLHARTAVDVAYTAGRPRLALYEGEILLEIATPTTARAPDVTVLSAAGTVACRQGRLGVRCLDDGRTAVTAFDAPAVLTPRAGGPRVLAAGHTTWFAAHGRVGTSERAPAGGDAWTHGMLIADATPLVEVIAAFARYHDTPIACAPELTTRTVSGAFTLDELHASLQLLARVLAVRIERDDRGGIRLRAA